MIEENKVHCKICKELKSRILAGKFDNVNKKYTDETGKLWNGKSCPQCTVLKAREHMRLKRNVK